MIRLARALPLAAVALLGCSVMVDPSGIEPGTPPTPTGVTATAGNGTATIHWNPVAGDVASIRIHAGTTSGNLPVVATVAGTATQADVGSLANGTTYYFALDALDSVGTVSALSDEASATPFVPDTTPPSMGATVPANGATGVAVDSSFTISFSEPMDVGSVVVGITPSMNLGPPTWNDTATQVSFAPATLDPPSLFTVETTYSVSVTGSDPAGNVMTSAGVFGFSTVAVPPTVLSTTPQAAATGVPVGATVVVNFSEPMEPIALAGVITISPSVTGWSCSWLAGNLAASCSHSSNFADLTVYTVTVGTGVRDVAGANMAAAFPFSFTTGQGPDVVKPTVTTTSPANLAIGAALATNITVTFSEDVDKTSAQAAFQILSPTGHNTGSFTWSDGKTMTFNPDVDFGFGENVSCRVSTAVKDMANNYMAADYNFGFREIRQATQTLYSVAANDGYLWSDLTTAYTTLTYMYVGDKNTPTGANGYARSFVHFDLSALPSTATAIDSATLYLYQESTYAGDPYALGYVYAERVDYGTSLTSADLTTPVLQHFWRFTCVPLPCHALYADDLYTLSTALTAGWKSTVVTTSAANAWTDRATYGNRLQFRMRFGTTTDNDNVSDYVRLTSGDASTNRPYVSITYQYP